MRGSVHEVISLSARFPLCATAAWPGSPMLAFHKVLWSRPTLPRLALCATAAWPGSPMLAFHKLLLVYGYSAAGHSLGAALHSGSGRLCSRRIPKARDANIFKLVY
jgi:hypothetical protein